MINQSSTSIPKLVWVTDTHLDHIDKGMSGFYNREPIERFLKALNDKNPGMHKVLCITGDISNAVHIVEHLEYLNQHLSEEYSKIFFVLGNHDFYGGSIVGVRASIKNLCSRSRTRLVYLTDHQYIPISENVAIVGHDGWYDGGYADWFAPGVVVMNDYYIIKEFMGKTENGIYSLMQQFSNAAACHTKDGIKAALDAGYKQVVFLTHVPPFRENSVYNGNISNNFWMPNFSCKLMGDALLQLTTDHPELQLWSLCGHSHGKATFKAKNNLISITGKAEYGFPHEHIHQLTLR